MDEKTLHSSELVAVEDCELDAVAGGFSFAGVKIDTDIKTNIANVIGNTVVAAGNGDVIIAITQNN